MGDMRREEGVGERGASLSHPAVLTLQEEWWLPISYLVSQRQLIHQSKIKSKNMAFYIRVVISVSFVVAAYRIE